MKPNPAVRGQKATALQKVRTRFLVSADVYRGRSIVFLVRSGPSINCGGHFRPEIQDKNAMPRF
jgi:hypothetical protein